MIIPTYLDALALARQWRQRNTRDDWLQAETLLRQARIDHPNSLEIGNELVLVQEKLGQDEAALALLHELERQFQDAGEETLCRFGKYYKKRAERPNKPAVESINDYHRSEGYYHRAYEKNFTHYPRINELTVRFLRAVRMLETDQSAESDPLLSTVRDDAAMMLEDDNIWRFCKVDDNIWVPATRGEAYLLMQLPIEAEREYQTAMVEASGRMFYHECMARQVKLLLNAYEKLQQPITGPLTDPIDFFKLPEDFKW